MVFADGVWMMDTDGGNLEIFWAIALLCTVLTVALVIMGLGAGRVMTIVVGVAMVTGLTTLFSTPEGTELAGEDLFVT